MIERALAVMLALAPIGALAAEAITAPKACARLLHYVGLPRTLDPVQVQMACGLLAQYGSDPRVQHCRRHAAAICDARK